MALIKRVWNFLTYGELKMLELELELTPYFGEAEIVARPLKVKLLRLLVAI